MTPEQREALAYAKGYEAGLKAVLEQRDALLSAVKDSLKVLKVSTAHLEAVIEKCERLEALQGKES